MQKNDIFLKYSVKSPQKGALTRFLSTFASMKTLTDTEYIHALIAEGEHQQQDFKFEISDARKIAKTLSAFANTDGGKLLIGVKDNGKIAGVRSDEEQYMIEAAAGLYCSPRSELHHADLSGGRPQCAGGTNRGK